MLCLLAREGGDRKKVILTGTDAQRSRGFRRHASDTIDLGLRNRFTVLQPTYEYHTMSV